MTDLHWQSATEIAAAVNAGKLSPVDLVKKLCDRIRSVDGPLGAFLKVCEADALTEAQAVLDKVQSGAGAGPLAGVPIGLKDVVATRGVETTAGSRMLANWKPAYDATIVKRLRAAGAIILGKLNMDEFAMGSTNENSAFKPCRNPWNPEHVAGGSSGGPAAAVTSGLCPVSIGTDTGGSIRQPASFCGCVGIRPTYGRVSRYGIVAYASSLDQVGPMARTVEDCAVTLSALAGADLHDATSVDHPVPDYLSACTQGVEGLRVGIAEEFFAEGLRPEVAERVRAAIDQLKALGATPVPIKLPHLRYGVAAYYLIATAEASSNLARYDGIRYGHRADAQDLDQMYRSSRTEGFGAETTLRILLGTYVLRSGYYDAYYLKAQKVRTLIKQDFDRAFEHCDVIAGPVAPLPAFRLGDNAHDPLAVYLADIYTVPCNLAGLPGISVPCGRTPGGLPVGLQLLGPAFAEATLFRVAGAYQNATSWHTQHPPIDDSTQTQG